MRVLFFFLILFSTAQAQIVIPSDSITIVQKNAFITFLRQENDVFFRANLTYRPYLKWYINKQNTYFINKEPDAKVLSPEKLRSSSFDEFLHKRYVIKVAEKRYFISVVNRYLVSLQVYERCSNFQEKYATTLDNTNQKWCMKNVFHLHPLVYDFSNNKQIYAFLFGSFPMCYILPLSDGNKIFINDHINKEMVSTNLKESFLAQLHENDFKELEENFFQIKPKGNKYELITFGNVNVLPQTYDSIEQNKFFILAKDGNRTDIYNRYLQKLNFPTLKAVYLYRTGIQVLDNNGAYCCDVNGNKVKELPEEKIHFTCGNVTSYRYEIMKKPMPYVELSGGQLGESYVIKQYNLTDRNENENITFVNNKTFTGSGNKPQWLRVQQGNLFGLFEYEYHKSHQLKGKQLLPIAFDKIEQDKNEQILFYQNGKVAIYPQFSTPQYDVLVPITNAFYQIEKNGRKGFLDIYTLEEYF
jgi:hypothetical protein